MNPSFLDPILPYTYMYIVIGLGELKIIYRNQYSRLVLHCNLYGPIYKESMFNFVLFLLAPTHFKFCLWFLDCENGICNIHQHITYWDYVAARPFLCPTATREVAVLLRTFTWASTPCTESASLARVSACTCYTQRKVLYRQPTIPWHFQTKIPWHLCMKFDEINRWNFKVFSNI